MSNDKDVWITGIGIVSSLGEGNDAHWQALSSDKPASIIDHKSFSPYAIHPICELDYSTQIPKRGDLRQMEDWQRIGVYAAGLALDMAKVKGDESLLDKTHIVAAASNGERDVLADKAVLEALKDAPDWRAQLNDLLLTNLRPTLYLAQQSQLLAGNISIVHKVKGGSRSYKGEEIAGAQIIEDAVNRITSGQNDIFLVGASYNAARLDQLLIWELNGRGDIVTGSMGVFMVVESKKHAQKRGVKPFAKIADVQLYNHRSATPSVTLGNVTLGNLENHPENLGQLKDLASIFGHGVEAQFPLGVALAALAASKQSAFSPFTEPLAQMTVRAFAAKIGEATARIERVADHA